MQFKFNIKKIVSGSLSSIFLMNFCNFKSIAFSSQQNLNNSKSNVFLSQHPNFKFQNKSNTPDNYQPFSSNIYLPKNIMLRLNDTLKLGYWCCLQNVSNSNEVEVRFYLPGFEGVSNLICQFKLKGKDVTGSFIDQLIYDPDYKNFKLSRNRTFPIDSMSNFEVRIYKNNLVSLTNFIAKSEVNIRDFSEDKFADCLPLYNNLTQGYTELSSSDINYNTDINIYTDGHNGQVTHFIITLPTYVLGLSGFDWSTYSIKVVVFVEEAQREHKDVDLSYTTFDVSDEEVYYSSTERNLKYIVPINWAPVDQYNYEIHFYKNEVKTENFLCKAFYRGTEINKYDMNRQS